MMPRLLGAGCAAVVAGLLALVPVPGLATAPDLAALAATPRWQSLMHVNPGATLRGIGSSYVDDADFFLSDQGKRSAVAELRASVAALRAPGSAARCRFPARYRFLAEALGWQEAAPLAHCEDYLQWREQMPTGQLVLVFPAAYLNSPSSMFGHTLLRLDAKPNPDSVWLSKAINFGAQAGAADNSFFYIWRGLAGGYPGQFSVTAYAEKIRDYAFVENRDMWEYALNLDADEMDWVVRHLWELRGINFDYYFFDENCSYRLLELVKVGRPTAPLSQELRFAELPVNTVRALDDAGLVADRRYRPSKAREVAARAARLDPAARALAVALRDDPSVAATPAFENRPSEQRRRIAELAYRALRLEHREGARNPDVAADSLALLRIVQRNAAPPSAPVSAPPAPESGHDTQMASMGAGRQDGRDFLSLGYRLTYHDLFDPLPGFLPGAAIEGLNINLRFDEVDGASLETLDLINIRSLAPRDAFTQPISWFVHTGLEQAPVADSERALGGFIQGGPGASWRVGDLLPYVFGVARLESVSGVDPAMALGAGAEAGIVYQANVVQWGVHARWLKFTPHFSRLRTGAVVNVPVSRDNALRGECGRETWDSDAVNSCSVSFRHFFD
ncbi:DUF4105 domain-containing protein [uncultured Salinisphaera sp.]|uniref:Lnb N-terminal periplasmic domain-containing protein n=1 Tax=uncultured Salinisphaera sp. TaxID=359372 RepID=UPI0032B1FD2B